MNSYSADLHIHSVLSPCGDLGMSPFKIVEEAAKKEIDIIAVCDHNHTGHARLTRQLGARKGIWVVYGAEICTREEVHCLTFFDSDEQLNAFQSLLDESLPKIPNDVALFGHQLIVDEYDQIVEEISYSLYPGVEWDIEETARIVHKLGGLIVPAHVDRPRNGLFVHLGLWPVGLQVDGVEISRNTSREAVLLDHPELADYTMISNSDAHFQEDIGRSYSHFRMKVCAFDEFRMALRGEEGRRVEL